METHFGFIREHGQGAIIESYLQLLAEDKLRRDAQLNRTRQLLQQAEQTLTTQRPRIEMLEQELAQTQSVRTQQETSLTRQQNLLDIYRDLNLNAKERLKCVETIFEQAFSAADPDEALYMYREISMTSRSGESPALRQLRALSRFNIGVIHATLRQDTTAARQSYVEMLDLHGSDPDSMIQRLCGTARQYLTELDENSKP